MFVPLDITKNIVIFSLPFDRKTAMEAINMCAFTDVTLLIGHFDGKIEHSYAVLRSEMPEYFLDFIWHVGESCILEIVDEQAELVFANGTHKTVDVREVALEDLNSYDDFSYCEMSRKYYA